MAARGKPKPETIAYARTSLGQALYDCCMSRMSAKECVRRHPELTRTFVLKMRREWPDLRSGRLKQNKKGGGE